MSRPSVNKQNLWKRNFQQKAKTVFANSERANVKVFLAGAYIVVKFYGKSVRLPAASVGASLSLVKPLRRESSSAPSVPRKPEEKGRVQCSKAGSSGTLKRTAAENRRRHVKRKQNELQLLIHQNFSPDTAVFVTLTFRQNSRDLRSVIKECQNLFARFRRHVPDVKYIAVPERHAQGSWHVHLLLDRELPHAMSVAKPFIEAGSIKSKSGSWDKLWPLGLYHQKKLDQGGNLGASIAAYVMKNATDKELSGHHTVWKSDNLQPPTEICGHDANNIIKSLVKEGLSPSYGYSCESCDFVNSMHVFEFCLDPKAVLLDKKWRAPGCLSA